MGCLRIECWWTWCRGVKTIYGDLLMRRKPRSQARLLFFRKSYTHLSSIMSMYRRPLTLSLSSHGTAHNPSLHTRSFHAKSILHDASPSPLETRLRQGLKDAMKAKDRPASTCFKVCHIHLKSIRLHTDLYHTIRRYLPRSLMRRNLQHLRPKVYPSLE